jgi:molybdate transport system regulatory protein
MFRVKGRIWIESDEGVFIGYGRIELLKKIKELGSITKAAKSMRMSYRHAWEQIDSMSRQSGKILVVRQTGGQGGGGSVLTEYGERIIAQFEKVERDFNRFIKEESMEIMF